MDALPPNLASTLRHQSVAAQEHERNVVAPTRLAAERLAEEEKLRAARKSLFATITAQSLAGAAAVEFHTHHSILLSEVREQFPRQFYHGQEVGGDEYGHRGSLRWTYVCESEPIPTYGQYRIDLFSALTIDADRSTAEIRRIKSVIAKAAWDRQKYATFVLSAHLSETQRNCAMNGMANAYRMHYLRNGARIYRRLRSGMPLQADYTFRVTIPNRRK